MSPKKRILVPVDFSEASDAALEYAIGLASRLDAQLDLLHAYGVPARAFASYGVTLPEEVGTAVREAASGKLLEALQKAQQSGVSADMHIEEAAPVAAITSATERLGVDWVVMATRGLSGVKHALLGSVAERILRASRCPVMTVKERRKDSAALRLSRIVIPMDLSPASRHALDLARELAATVGPSELSLVYAFEMPPAFASIAARGADEVIAEVTRVARRELDQLVAEISDEGLSVSHRLTQGSPDQVIVDAARREGADLIVMGTHGRTGLAQLVLGSVAQKVVRNSPCPTVTVRA